MPPGNTKRYAVYDFVISPSPEQPWTLQDLERELLEYGLGLEDVTVVEINRVILVESAAKAAEEIFTRRFG